MKQGKPPVNSHYLSCFAEFTLLTSLHENKFFAPFHRVESVAQSNSRDAKFGFNRVLLVYAKVAFQLY